MGIRPAPGERYTIRRKLLTFLGAGFHVYDTEGRLFAFCRQRAFKLREDIRFYTDESMSQEVFRMKALSILDFSTTYQVLLPDGSSIGSLRRKGMRSLLRDEWAVFGASDDSGESVQIGRIQEDSTGLAVLRRVTDGLQMFFPQRFRVERFDGEREGGLVAELRQHFNPLVYKLGVRIESEDEEFDELLILACGCLIAAIEGRQG